MGVATLKEVPTGVKPILHVILDSCFVSVSKKVWLSSKLNIIHARSRVLILMVYFEMIYFTSSFGLFLINADLQLQLSVLSNTLSFNTDCCFVYHT